MSERNNNFSQNWWIRKAFYLVVALLGLVATGFGFVTQDQVDAATASPILATLVGLVAGFFTNRGSGDPTTKDDLVAAQPDAETVAQLVFDKIDSYGKHAADIGDQVQAAATSVADYYNREK